MLLNLNHVTVHYGDAEVIKDVTIDLEEGTVVSVIGANGAGKSTMLKAISGLVPLHSGDILFSGNRINRMPINRIVELGIAHVPESRSLFPFMSVFANIKLGAYLRRDKSGVRADMAEVFRLFPVLEQRGSQNAGSLSGGEQQMLAIARALMARPKLLMMDEPSLGLAPIMIDLLAETIININRKGISVLLVEQNAGLVTRVARKCYVMEVGSIVFEGDMKELMENDTVRRAFLG